MIDFSLLKIIPADESHKEFSYQVKKAAEGDYISQIWGWDEELQKDFHEHDWEQKRPSIILYNGKVIGTIYVQETDDFIKIGQFFILPENQNKGIGSYILKGILEKADSSSRITKITYLKNNPVESLYKRHGFEIIGERDEFYFTERKPAIHNKPERKYKAVIFDLFGTLVDIFSRQEYENVVTQMAQFLKAPYDKFYKIWMQTAKQRTTGILGTSEENLEYICRELKISVTESQIEKARRVRFNYVARALTPRKDAIEVISSLKSSGYKIGLISNCSTEPPVIWPGTPFAPFFDTALFSSVVGINKPDRRIFQMAVERLMVEPSKCVYIGDGDDNELAAAAALGMKPVLIRASHENSADALRPDDETKDFTGPVITSLKEVLNLVK